MNKSEIHDIAFKILSFQDQLKKIKKYIITNPYLLLDINIDLDLNEKYHEFFKRKSFNKELNLLLENLSTRDHCMQIIQRKYSINNNES